MQGVQHKGEVGLGFWRQYAGGGKTVVVDQCRVIAANPFDRVRRVGDDGVERFVLSKMRFDQGVAKFDIELVIVDVVQKHIHPRQVVSGVVDLLAEEALFNNMGVGVFFGLQQQRAGAAGGIVDFVDAGLLVQGDLRNQPGDMGGSEKLATGFTRIGGVVANQELVGIAEQVDVVVFKIAKVEPGHSFEYGRKAAVFVFDRIAKAVAGGIEIGKQALDVVLRRVAAGRGFDFREDPGQIGIQVLVAVGVFGDIGKQLAGIDKVTLGFNGVVLDVVSDNIIVKFGVVDAVITALDVTGKIFADKTVKKGAKHILFEIPAIDGAAYIVGDLPDLALQGGALLVACHGVNPAPIIWVLSARFISLRT